MGRSHQKKKSGNFFRGGGQNKFGRAGQFLRSSLLLGHLYFWCRLHFWRHHHFWGPLHFWGCPPFWKQLGVWYYQSILQNFNKNCLFRLFFSVLQLPGYWPTVCSGWRCLHDHGLVRTQTEELDKSLNIFKFKFSDQVYDGKTILTKECTNTKSEKTKKAVKNNIFCTFLLLSLSLKKWAWALESVLKIKKSTTPMARRLQLTMPACVTLTCKWNLNS